MNIAILIFTLIGCLLQLAVAQAQPAATAASGSTARQPSVKLALLKVTQQAGKDQLQSATSVAPGDVVEYQAVYTNPQPVVAKNVQVTLPVPDGGLQPVLPSMAAQAVTASTDGQRFEAVPLMRSRRLADGTEVKQPVPAHDYRFLRWNLGDVPAGATRSVSARMQFPSLASPVAPTESAPSSAKPSAP